MKINKDDELLASPEEFMIIDKIRKDQRAEFVKDLMAIGMRVSHEHVKLIQSYVDKYKQK